MDKRKYIRLYNFDYRKNGAYFITICTHNRQKIFGESPIVPEKWFRETGEMQYKAATDVSSSLPVGATPCGRPTAAEMVERWIHKLAEKFDNVIIDYYVIMPDHIHLIIILDDERDDHAGSPLQKEMTTGDRTSVSRVIDWFKTMTTNDYIRGVRQNLLPPFNHHLWQRGYYDHVIRNRDDLKECRRYIKSNPKNTDY